MVSDALLTVTEYIGVVAFAVSGAIAGIERDLDIFGITVLGITTATGGGIIRDLLLGVSPPMVFSTPGVLVAALFAVVAVIVAARIYLRCGGVDLGRGAVLLNLADALGLGVFSVTGVNIAITQGFGANGFLCVFVAVITGIGGGMLRDMMIGRTPKVLRRRIYAVASLAGAWLYYLLATLTALPGGFAIYTSISLVVLIRMLAAHFRWQLPRVGWGAEHSSGNGEAHVSK